MIYVYRENATDFQDTIKFINANLCNAVITPIVNPLFYREFKRQPMRDNHIRFTRSDLLLESKIYYEQLVTRLNDTIDCDSADENIQEHSVKTLKQELAYCQHLSSEGYALTRLQNTNTVNLTRILNTHFHGLYCHLMRFSQLIKLLAGIVLAEVPLINPKAISLSYRRMKGANTKAEDVTEDTWKWWNKFRSYAYYTPKFRVALELTEDLPAIAKLFRWLGEPVELIIIPSYIFKNNERNEPVLLHNHEKVVTEYLFIGAKLAIKIEPDKEPLLPKYIRYLRNLISNIPVERLQGLV